MITKNSTRNLFYIDRDTDEKILLAKILKIKEKEALIFIKDIKNRLQNKDAGKYYTLEDRLELKDGELENMMRFFRGAVVPYYARQKYDFWGKHIPTAMLKESVREIKKSVGFMLYDCHGKITKEVNSMLAFKKESELNEWLVDVENVCFKDNGYIFPNSKYFKELEKTKGRVQAQRQVIDELKEKIKNKFYKREIYV